MTPQRLAEIRSRLAGVMCCGSWWGLSCVELRDAETLGEWVDCGPDDMSELLTHIDALQAEVANLTQLQAVECESCGELKHWDEFSDGSTSCDGCVDAGWADADEPEHSTPEESP